MKYYALKLHDDGAVRLFDANREYVGVLWEIDKVHAHLDGIDLFSKGGSVAMLHGISPPPPERSEHEEYLAWLGVS